jgi:hypothetical protein
VTEAGDAHVCSQAGKLELPCVSEISEWASCAAWLRSDVTSLRQNYDGYNLMLNGEAVTIQSQLATYSGRWQLQYMRSDSASLIAMQPPATR